MFLQTTASYVFCYWAFISFATLSSAASVQQSEEIQSMFRPIRVESAKGGTGSARELADNAPVYLDNSAQHQYHRRLRPKKSSKRSKVDDECMEELMIGKNSKKQSKSATGVTTPACNATTVGPTMSPTGESGGGIDSPTLAPDEQEGLVTCVSVIDESDGQSDAMILSLWGSLRSKFPSRPFCLLRPEDRGYLLLPPSFVNDTTLNTYAIVSRDQGVEESASDWFDLCDLATSRQNGLSKVALFIDNSGSMYTSTVLASYELFQTRLAQIGMEIVTGSENSDEDWITPCLTTTVQVSTPTPSTPSPTPGPRNALEPALLFTSDIQAPSSPIDDPV
jgi:hypothetical protein